MKYTPNTIINTEFNLRKISPRPKSELINDIGDVNITNPVNEATGVAVDETITWNAITGFDRYRIIITRQSNGEVVVNATVTATSYTPSFDASTGYDIQVFTAQKTIQQAASTITGVSIIGSTSLVQNETTQLQKDVTGTGNYSNSVTWSSSNDAIATVDTAGLVTYVSGAVDNTIDITAISDQDNSFSDIHTLTIQSSGSAAAGDSQQDDEAFATSLYQATDGDNWFDRTGWETGEAVFQVGTVFDSPVGLEIADVNGELRITRIDFQKITTVPASLSGEQGDQHNGNNLTGQIDSLPWDNLSNCTYVNVKQNNLSGAIPSSMFLMENIQWISLGGQRSDLEIEDHQWNENNHQGQGFSKNWEETNAFTGNIPTTIGQALNLEILEIRRQWLTGTIPSEIGNATNLIGIFLNGQKGENLLGGQLPVQISNLINLKHFHIDNSDNTILSDPTKGFTGEIPQEVINMVELRHIRFRNQNFTGAFPIFDTYDLRLIDFNDNHFTGGFPIEYFQGDNPFMVQLLISGNNLSGDLPTNFIAPTGQTNYHSMSKFNIDRNSFTGSVPNWMQEMSGHQVVDLKSNNLTGAFPELILDQDQLKTFLISDNDFTGTLPNRAFASSRMLTLYANNNNFTGEIPPLWESLTNSSNRMLYLYLHNNELEGLIPSWLANITGITRIYLQNNRFTYKDIIPNVSAITATVTGNYDYSSQKAFNVPQDSFSDNVGATVTVDLSSIDYTNNVYQWQKLGGTWENISGEISHTLQITNAQTSDTGIYRLRITNPDLPNLSESLSREITINIG